MWGSVLFNEQEEDNMPEDLRKGFLKFQGDNFRFAIADDNALSAPGLQDELFTLPEAANSFADPGKALEAVQAAALEKSLHDDHHNGDGAADFFVEDYNMFM